MEPKRPSKASSHVTEARAAAQRAKLDTQTRTAAEKAPSKKSSSKQEQRDLLAKRRAKATIALAISDYLDDHEGGNHSQKTIQWHTTGVDPILEGRRKEI